MFPQVFVDVKVDAPVGVVGGGGGGEGEGEGGDDENVVVALFDYDGVEGDLSFKVCRGEEEGERKEERRSEGDENERVRHF